jgi:hypothetical protein
MFVYCAYSPLQIAGRLEGIERLALLLPMGGMGFCGFLRMMRRMQHMGAGAMSVVRRGFMMTGGVVSSRFPVVLCGLLVMPCGF